MMPYPAELTTGDVDSKKDPLSQFFKERGWDATWDFDNKGYWHEVSYKGKLIIQVEFGTPVDDMLESLKRLVPEFDASIMDDTSLRCLYDVIMTAGTEGGFYVWPTGKNPQRTDLF
jgi:hypothetical protein